MRLMLLLALLLVSGSLSAQTQRAIKRVRHVSRFELSVACIKKYEGLHGPKHHPYVGYGHKLLPGERYSPRMSERQADALLRSDLRKLHNQIDVEQLEQYLMNYQDNDTSDYNRLLVLYDYAKYGNVIPSQEMKN